MNHNMALGNRLEPVLLADAADKLGLPIAEFERQKFCISPEDDRFCATLDGWHPSGIIVECKVVTGQRAELFGEIGTDEVPIDILAQVFGQFYAAGPDAKVAYVSAGLIYDRTMYFNLYTILRPSDDDLHSVIDPAMKWFAAYPAQRIPPPECGGIIPAEFVRRMARKDSEKPLDPSLFDAFELAKAQKEAADLEYDKARDAILNGLIDGDEVSQLGTAGGWRATYKEQKTTPSVDHDQMKLDGVWSKYCTQRSVPVLRIYPPKKGKE